MTEPIVIGAGRVGGSRRVLVLAAVGVALLLAVVVLPGLVFGGGDSSVDDSFPPITASPTTTVAPDAEPVAETTEVFSGKNPFTPLVDLTPATNGDPATGVAVDTTPTTLPIDQLPVDDPGFVFPIADPAAPVVDVTPATTVPPRPPDRVSLLEVYSDLGGRLVASVRVNDVTYGVGQGDEFAFSYRVLGLDLQTRCATLLFGDDRFGLCEGQETQK